MQKKFMVSHNDVNFSIQLEDNLTCINQKQTKNFYSLTSFAEILTEVTLT
jgi:hypothetical protein